MDGEIETALTGLLHDYSGAPARIRCLEHQQSCECTGVTFRVHYPALRERQATVGELTEFLIRYLPSFALPHATLAKLHSQYGKLSAEAYQLKCNELQQEAIQLFKKAQIATNRNGECGELLLFLLTEWILTAPQLIAKMSLKTNPMMPVHGADGVHVRFCPDTKRLLLYWGESKIYADVKAAISASTSSMLNMLQHEAVTHELSLVRRNIDLSGLTDEAKTVVHRLETLISLVRSLGFPT